MTHSSLACMSVFTIHRSKKHKRSKFGRRISIVSRIEAARAQITKKPRLTILDAEILAYAKEHYDEHKLSGVGLWNGRQIRNAFQAAAALAYHIPGREGPILTPSLFKEVAKTTDEFDQYINTLNGEKNEEERAHAQMRRADHMKYEAGRRNRHPHAMLQPPSHPRDRRPTTNQGQRYSDSSDSENSDEIDD